MSIAQRPTVHSCKPTLDDARPSDGVERAYNWVRGDNTAFGDGIMVAVTVDGVRQRQQRRRCRKNEIPHVKTAD